MARTSQTSRKVRSDSQPASMAPANVLAQPRPTHEEIARRAYEIFVARGGEHGHDVDDWLQAERELTLGRH
ncbi:MAG TPA: DUF2934 domain-containing protein [Myxococcaceae bacterium]|nr:DUF2934 domain-containing protein [Myxococcaceae bacterium]